MKVLLFVLVLAHITTTVLGQTFGDAKNLTQALFLEYDTRIRPLQNQTDPTGSHCRSDQLDLLDHLISPIKPDQIYEVFVEKLGNDVVNVACEDFFVSIEVLVDFTLLAINDLDEVSETMKLTGFLTLTWVDEFLTWDPDDYGGLDYYLWPQSTIWKPDVSLGNSINEYKELGVMTLNMEVDFRGNIIWRPFEVFRSTCSFDTTYFPFDVQTCSLEFFAWSYTKAEVTMKGGATGIDLADYTPSSTWTLLDTSWSVEENRGESSIKYSFKAKRKPLFFILSIIMPIILLAFLNLFVFALPCESGERAGFSVTVFLALAVFLTIVSENLPKNSDKVSIFAIYMIILTMQSTVITIVAMMTIRWSHNSDATPIPKWMLCVANCLMRCTFNRKVSDNSDVGHEQGGAGETASDDHVTDKEYKSSTVNHFKVTNETCDTETTSDDTKKHVYTWTEIVRAMDVLFFIVFFVIFIVITIICFIVSSAATK